MGMSISITNKLIIFLLTQITFVAQEYNKLLFINFYQIYRYL